MSYLKSVNWARLWKRVIWTFFFACFLALVVFMSKDMANNQPVIFGMVILAAVVTAVAFVYARTSKEALAIAICGLFAHIFLEASYWSSTIEDINAQAGREKLAADARGIVAEKRKQRYDASASGKSPAQIRAEIEAHKQHARWASTKGCVDATVPESRDYCQTYHLLMADLAAAREAERLESVVWQTSIEVDAVPRNLAKGAIFISSLTGMSIEDATNLLVIVLVLFMQAGLAGSLRVGYAPDRSPAGPAAKPASFAPRRPAGLPEYMARQRPKLDAPDPTPLPPDPDNGGTPKEEQPEREDQAETPDAAKAENVIQMPAKSGTPDVPKPKKREGKTEHWLSDCTSQDSTRQKKASISDCYASYQAWCQINGLYAISKKALSREIAAKLKLPKSKDGPRNSGGRVFPGLLVFHPSEQKRKVA